MLGRAGNQTNRSIGARAPGTAEDMPKKEGVIEIEGTIVEALRGTFKRFHESGAIVLSYGSNALPDKETIASLLREVKRDVEVRAIPHTYHYGTHRSAARRSVDEYIFVAR